MKIYTVRTLRMKHKIMGVLIALAAILGGGLASAPQALAAGDVRCDIWTPAQPYGNGVKILGNGDFSCHSVQTGMSQNLGVVTMTVAIQYKHKRRFLLDSWNTKITVHNKLVTRSARGGVRDAFAVCSGHEETYRVNVTLKSVARGITSIGSKHSFERSIYCP